MASSSACALASCVASTLLPARASNSPAGDSTQAPTGTSPRAAAARASSRATAMAVAWRIPRLAPQGLPGLGTRMARPLIGVTLDAEQPGGWSRFPWYALRANYTDAVAGSGGLPMALPHDPALAAEMLDRLDGLVVTGGAFDVDPALYGATTVHATVTLKDRRTAAELALVQGALARDMPVLGICGGQQLLAVALGGTLIQHIPDSVADALEHEQPNPRDQPGHAVAVVPGTQLHRIVGADTMQVNSAHHQAVASPGPHATVNATAPDGVIEGVEDARYRFAIGLQWHPEFLIDPGDRRVFDAFIAACA